MPRTILITSIYYAPETFGNAPYVTGLAEMLAARGDRVVVVTSFPHYPWWRIERQAPLAHHERVAGVDIRRRRHYVPRTQDAVRRGAYELSFLLAGLTALRRSDRPHA